MTDSPLPETPATGALDEIEAIITRARDGTLPGDAAFAAIGRIVDRRASTAETYQKPWG